MEIRRKGALIPLSYARPGDFILVPGHDCVSDRKEIRIWSDCRTRRHGNDEYSYAITLRDLPVLLEEYSGEDLSILPWGWNPALRHQLRGAGVPESMLPADDWLLNLRDISHRRSSIYFNRRISELIASSGYQALPAESSGIIPAVPQEFFDVESAWNYYLRNKSDGDGEIFFKAPWSSSGRGILFTKDLSGCHIMPWLRGIIRSQGSVIAEKAVERTADFASEWIIEDSSEGQPLARFLHYSAFEASPRGKYHFNIRGSQDDIVSYLSGRNIIIPPALIEMQKKVLGELCGSYRGYCGIDMLGDMEGNIYPCIEINWRLTMGIISGITS